MIFVFGGICIVYVCFLENFFFLFIIWYVIKLIFKLIFFMEIMVVILYYNMYKIIKSIGICYFNWG